jgi:transposase InsO family protein
VDTFGLRKTAHIFGAISLDEAKCTFRFAKVFNGSTFFEFLRQLVSRYKGRKIFLIIDNGPCHWLDDAGRLWLQQNRHLIELHRLPAYSPEFMPDDHAQCVLHHYRPARHGAPADVLRPPAQAGPRHLSGRAIPMIKSLRENVWSWDITYLKSALRGCFFYLYLVVDIWSRKIVGWSVEASESTDSAAELFRRICAELDLDPEGLVLHSDNGGPMKGSTMLATLQRLGVVPSFSRPHVSDDNAYSESLFHTLKYRPSYPSRPFESIEEARAWVADFVAWYNGLHLHSSISFVTPEDRHSGRDTLLLERRRHVYERARRRHPERWSGATRNWEHVEKVRLNPEHTAEAVYQELAA